VKLVFSRLSIVPQTHHCTRSSAIPIHKQKQEENSFDHSSCLIQAIVTLTGGNKQKTVVCTSPWASEGFFQRRKSGLFQRGTKVVQFHFRTRK